MDIKALGDIRLNGKPYRVDIASYRDRDVVDFAPRAGTPGGSVIHSELGLYQPLLQTDWQHGFGFHWYEDAAGYLATTGNIDARHNGLVMLSTKSTSSDTDNYVKEGFVTWNNAVWAYGDHGIRKYSGGAWAQAQDVSGTDTSDVTLQPCSADAYIYQKAPTTKEGTETSLIVGESNAATQLMRSLLKFDLSTIPATATITAATLSLYMYEEKSSNARTMSVYRMLKDWSEASVTWNKSDATTNWTTAGGANAADCEAASIADTAFSATEAVGWKTFTLDPAKVQEWINSTLANYGMMLRVDTESSDQYRFYSSEYATDTTLRPKLAVTYTTPALSDTGAVNFALAGGSYLFYCPDGARIRKISVEGTDSFAGNDSSSIDYKWLVQHAGYIYAGKDGSNHVHRDSTSDLSDLEGTTADTDIIYVGSEDDAFPTLRAIVYAGSLYIARADGLWCLGDDLIARRVLDFSAEASSDNFRGMVEWNGYLLFPIRDKIYQWNGARLSDVTPPRITDTFPFTTYGRFDNFTAMGRFMYCTARTNESTYAEDLLSFDGVGWHKLMRLVSNGTDTITAMNYDPVNNYLWYHLDSTADATYYIPFQSNSEFPYADFPTSGTHYIVSSRLDMGYRWVDKSSPSLVVEAYNVSSNCYLKIYYSIDNGAWTAWSDENITVPGFTTLRKPAGLQTIEYNQMKLRVDFVTNDATQSPILESLTLRFIMRPDDFYSWSFNIPIAQGMNLGDTVQYVSVHEVLQDLRDARSSKSPIEFIDIFNDRHLVYITSNTGQAIEYDASEGGPHPNIEYVRTLTVVEAEE